MNGVNMDEPKVTEVFSRKNPSTPVSIRTCNFTNNQSVFHRSTSQGLFDLFVSDSLPFMI